MFEYLEKLRQKSDKSKRRMAFLISLSFCSVILLVWTTVVIPDIGQDNADNSAAVSAASPTKNFIDVASDAILHVKNSIGQAKESISNLASSTSHFQNQNISTSTPNKGDQNLQNIEPNPSQNMDINQ